MRSNRWWPGRWATAVVGATAEAASASGIGLERRNAGPLRLTVLGQVELLWKDGGVARDLTEVLTPKQQEILVFVALGLERGVAREALNNAVWPARSLARPYNSLHNALSLLRSTLARETDGLFRDVIIASGGFYRLDDRVVDVDYWRFRHLVSQESGKVVELWRGDVAESLRGLWLESARVAVRREVLDAVGSLISVGDVECFSRVAGVLERMRAVDPYNEAVYRDIIRVQVALGQIEGARRTFGLLVAALKDLGCGVSRETVDFLASVKSVVNGNVNRVAS